MKKLSIPLNNKSCNVATKRYHRHKYRHGDTVIIKNSSYSGVNVGDIGIVDCLVKQGYGIAFTKTWPSTVINEKPPFEKRILFFEHGELK